VAKHFRIEFISEKTGKLVCDPETSYCGKTPAVALNATVISGWCEDCMKIFEAEALGIMAPIIRDMSKS
jgi:hypothetical protein